MAFDPQIRKSTKSLVRTGTYSYRPTPAEWLLPFGIFGMLVLMLWVLA